MEGRWVKEKSPVSPTLTAYCTPTPLLPFQMGTDKNKPLTRPQGIFLRIPRAIVSLSQPISKDWAGVSGVVLRVLWTRVMPVL